MDAEIRKFVIANSVELGLRPPARPDPFRDPPDRVTAWAWRDVGVRDVRMGFVWAPCDHAARVSVQPEWTGPFREWSRVVLGLVWWRTRGWDGHLFLDGEWRLFLGQCPVCQTVWVGEVRTTATDGGRRNGGQSAGTGGSELAASPAATFSGSSS